MKQGSGMMACGAVVVLLAAGLWINHGYAMLNLQFATSKGWAEMVKRGTVSVDPTKGAANGIPLGYEPEETVGLFLLGGVDRRVASAANLFALAMGTVGMGLAMAGAIQRRRAMANPIR